MGIYLDDMMSGVECFGNIIDNVPLGIQLGGGHYNKIENNIIANSDDRDNIITSIYADSRGCEDWFKDTFDVSGDKTYIKDCIFIKEIINKGCLTKNVWIEKYPQIRKILETDFKKPQNNSIMKNIIYKHTNVKITQYVIDNGTVSDNVRFTSNPGFSNPQNGDYSFDTAPIEGFLPIPCDKIGIIEDGV